jgi:hypothetical protein
MNPFGFFRQRWEPGVGWTDSGWERLKFRLFGEWNFLGWVFGCLGLVASGFAYVVLHFVWKYW